MLRRFLRLAMYEELPQVKEALVFLYQEKSLPLSLLRSIIYERSVEGRKNHLSDLRAAIKTRPCV